MARTGIFPKTAQQSEVSQELINLVTSFREVINYDASATYHHPETFGTADNPFGKQASIESRLFNNSRVFIHVILNEFRLFINLPFAPRKKGKKIPEYAPYMDAIIKKAQELGAEYHVEIHYCVLDKYTHDATPATKKESWWLSPTYPTSGEHVKTFEELMAYIATVTNGHSKWIQPINGNIYRIENTGYCDRSYRSIGDNKFIRIG